MPERRKKDRAQKGREKIRNGKCPKSSPLARAARSRKKTRKKRILRRLCRRRRRSWASFSRFFMFFHVFFVFFFHLSRPSGFSVYDSLCCPTLAICVSVQDRFVLDRWHCESRELEIHIDTLISRIRRWVCTYSALIIGSNQCCRSGKW